MNEPIQLPPPQCSSGVDLVAALRLRQSTRSFNSSKPLPEDVLSLLLWSANGVNRAEGGRTAPSAFGGNQVWIYVVKPEGIYRYDAPAHSLVEIRAGDFRHGLCPDEWTATGAISILLTGRTREFPDFVTPAFAIELLQATAGCIGENLHLVAAAFGLGTCMVGHMNTERVHHALKLSADEVPLYVMPVGYLN